MKVIVLYFMAMTVMAIPRSASAQALPADSDHLKVADSVKFQGRAYILVSSKVADSQYINTYIMDGDTLEHYKSLIMLRYTSGETDIKDLVTAKMTELRDAKLENPLISYEMFENKKVGEYMLDFLISQNTPDGKWIENAERSVYRYRTITDSTGKKGTLLFAVSTKQYDDDVEAFLNVLKTSRNDMLKAVSTFVIPATVFGK